MTPSYVTLFKTIVCLMLERQSYYFSITLRHYVQSAHDSIRDSTLILSLKIAKGNFVGYYAIITETTENMQTITK